MSTFRLHIYVVGLVALVPHFGGDNSLAAYLPTVTGTCEEHVPVVLFPCSDAKECAFDAASIAADLKIGLYSGLLGSGAHYGGMRLDRERVTVSVASKGDALHDLVLAGGRVARASDVTGALPQTRSEAKALDWLPNLGAISADHRHLRKDLREPKDGTEVAGIFDLQDVQGTVRVLRMAEMNGQVPVIKFEVTSLGQSLTVLRQAVPEVVEIDIEMQGEAATLTAKKYSYKKEECTGKDCRSVTLPSTSGGSVDILVANLQVPSLCYFPDLMGHFNHYFMLAGGPFTMASDTAVAGKFTSSKQLELPGWPEIAKVAGYGYAQEPQKKTVFPLFPPSVGGLQGEDALHAAAFSLEEPREELRRIALASLESRQLCTLAVVEPPKQ